MHTSISSSNSNSDRKVAVGAIAGGFVNIFRIGLQLVLLPIMARLLGPDEFGLYALALPTVGLVALLSDGGLGATLAREQETSSLIWSSAFWALLLIGITLAAGSTIFGIFLGYVTHQPRLPAMIGLLSLSLIFMTLSVVPSARLTRRKNLKVGAGVDLAGNVAGAVIAVAMAWNGGGAWSLAAQYVSTYAIRAVLLNAAAFHLPSAQFSFTALRSHLVSGGILIASRLFEFGGRSAESFLVDRIFGTALLGSYNFANQISKFSTDAASNVVWSALYVQALTEKKDRVVILHRQLCRLLAVMLFPATFLAAAAAPELISSTLGPKWPELSLLIRILLPIYAFTAIFAQTGPLLLAYGRFDLQFWCMVGFSFGRALAVGLGYFVGLEAAVAMVAAVSLLFCVSMMIVPAKETGCRPIPVLLGMMRPAISSVVATAGFFLISRVLPPTLIWTFVSLAGGLVAYTLCMLLIDSKGLIEDWQSVRRILSLKRN